MTDFVGSAAILVKDRKRSARWFRGNFGWKVYGLEDDHWTTVGAPGKGARIHLCESGRTLSSRDVGESGILIVCKDFDATCRRLERNGARWATRPKHQPWGPTARVKDPDGNILWLSDSV